VNVVKASSKFQAVIPGEVREKLEIKAGQKLQFIPYMDRIEFIPQKNIKEMKGFLKGVDTRVPGERDRI
jgi:AbrB family looped-hinge helix DNA binding protein